MQTSFSASYGTDEGTSSGSKKPVKQALKESNSMSDVNVSERVFSMLFKEQNKKKPNMESISYFLQLDFQSRRGFVKSIAREKRLEKLFEKYPILKNDVQVCYIPYYFWVHIHFFVLCFYFVHSVSALIIGGGDCCKY